MIVSHANDAVLERNIALFGSAGLRLEQLQSIETKDDFVDALHLAQSFAAPPPKADGRIQGIVATPA